MVLMVAFIMLFAAFHVGGVLLVPALIKNGGIVSAVKVDVRFDEKMIGEHLPAIAQKNLQNTVPLILADESRLQNGCDRKGGRGQQQENQKRCCRAFHAACSLDVQRFPAENDPCGDEKRGNIERGVEAIQSA